MAENLETTTVKADSGQQQQELSYEELLKKYNDAETRALNAEASAEKWKNTHDKTSSELAGIKKQLNERLSAEEQAAEAEKEAKAQRDADFEAMKNKVHMFEYGKRYMGVGMDEKTADTMAALTGELEDPDKFFSVLGKFAQSLASSSAESAVQKLLKDRPEIKAGSGSSERNALAKEKAKESANRRSGANSDILKHYIPGGMI